MGYCTAIVMTMVISKRNDSGKSCISFGSDWGWKTTRRYISNGINFNNITKVDLEVVF